VTDAQDRRKLRSEDPACPAWEHPMVLLQKELAAGRKLDRKSVAMSRTILFDAIFAIVFAIVMVTIARSLFEML
jgi:hypothetical protein